MKTFPLLPALLLLMAVSLLPTLALAQRPAQNKREWREEGNAAAEREEVFFGVRAYPFGRIPQNGRLDAILYSQSKIRPFHDPNGLQGKNQWEQIGPLSIGGRISTIAVHPTDSNTLWAGAAAGGVWRSFDRGESWRPMMDFENAITMGALAVDPQDPLSLYAGTGEAAQNVDSYGGAGVMKSTDGGLSWQSAGLMNVAAFARLAVHPKRSGIIFAAAIHNNAGLYRSPDAGRSWVRIISTPVTDITINPANPDEMWIGGNQAGVMHSTDAGLTFIPSGTGLGLNGAFVGRVSVQVAPSKPSTLYALINEASFPQGNYSRIYKSTNSGTTWQNVLDNAPDLLNYYGHLQGEYNNVIAVKPDDPECGDRGGSRDSRIDRRRRVLEHDRKPVASGSSCHRLRSVQPATDLLRQRRRDLPERRCRGNISQKIRTDSPSRSSMRWRSIRASRT